MTQVKICGIQDTAHALAVADAGADFLGLVFVPGRRRKIESGKAREITTALRQKAGKSPMIVGLFANQPLDEVNRIAQECELDIVQLCGSESVEYCKQVAKPLIKVLHVDDSLDVVTSVADLSQKIASFQDRSYKITLDSKVDGLDGGTGQNFNHEIAKVLAEQGFAFLLAGGLTPQNVGDAVKKVGPWGVDVSSGVETDGVKNPRKIKEFMDEVHSASQVVTRSSKNLGVT